MQAFAAGLCTLGNMLGGADGLHHESKYFLHQRAFYTFAISECHPWRIQILEGLDTTTNVTQELPPFDSCINSSQEGQL